MRLHATITLLFVALLLVAPFVGHPLDAKQPNLTAYSETTLNASATGVSGNTSATFTATQDAKEFAIFYRATSNATVNYRLDWGATVDGSTYVYEPTGTVSNNILGNAWHYAVISVPACYGIQMKATDLGTTQGATVTVIIVNR